MAEENGEARRILVVDDEPLVCDCLKEIFNKAGMHVDIALNAEQALQLFREKTYALVTLDYYMPGINGAALHQTLSRIYGFGKRLPDSMPQRLPPVLVITGYPQEPEVRDIFFRERIVGVLQKPIRSRELLRIVTEVLQWEDTRSSRRAKALTRLGALVTRKGAGDENE